MYGMSAKDRLKRLQEKAEGSTNGLKEKDTKMDSKNKFGRKLSNAEEKASIFGDIKRKKSSGDIKPESTPTRKPSLTDMRAGLKKVDKKKPAEKKDKKDSTKENGTDKNDKEKKTLKEKPEVDSSGKDKAELKKKDPKAEKLAKKDEVKDKDATVDKKTKKDEVKDDKGEKQTTKDVVEDKDTKTEQKKENVEVKEKSKLEKKTAPEEDKAKKKDTKSEISKDKKEIKTEAKDVSTKLEEIKKGSEKGETKEKKSKKEDSTKVIENKNQENQSERKVKKEEKQVISKPKVNETDIKDKSVISETKKEAENKTDIVSKKTEVKEDKAKVEKPKESSTKIESKKEESQKTTTKKESVKNEVKIVSDENEKGKKVETVQETQKIASKQKTVEKLKKESEEKIKLKELPKEVNKSSDSKESKEKDKVQVTNVVKKKDDTKGKVMDENKVSDAVKADSKAEAKPKEEIKADSAKQEIKVKETNDSGEAKVTLSEPDKKENKVIKVEKKAGAPDSIKINEEKPSVKTDVITVEKKAETEKPTVAKVETKQSEENKKEVIQKGAQAKTEIQPPKDAKISGALKEEPKKILKDTKPAEKQANDNESQQGANVCAPQEKVTVNKTEKKVIIDKKHDEKVQASNKMTQDTNAKKPPQKSLSKDVVLPDMNITAEAEENAKLVVAEVSHAPILHESVSAQPNKVAEVIADHMSTIVIKEASIAAAEQTDSNKTKDALQSTKPEETVDEGKVILKESQINEQEAVDNEVAALTESKSVETDAPAEPTEVIMNKTFTESKMPKEEFKPIPEEFFNTLFYFSGMGSVIASSLASGVYVPEQTAKRAPSAEVMDENDHIRRRSQCPGRDLVKSARNQCTSLSTDLRQLQALLSNLPTFGDQVEPLPPKAIHLPEIPIQTHTQLSEELNVPNSPQHPAAPWHQAPPPNTEPKKPTDMQKPVLPEQPKVEATTASELPGNAGGKYSSDAITNNSKLVKIKQNDETDNTVKGTLGQAKGIGNQSNANATEFEEVSEVVTEVRVAPAHAPPASLTHNHAPKPHQAPASYNITPAPKYLQSYAPTTGQTMGKMANGPPPHLPGAVMVMPVIPQQAKVIKPVAPPVPKSPGTQPNFPKPSSDPYVPKVQGREVGVHTGKPVIATIQQPWQLKYSTVHVTENIAPKPFAITNEIDTSGAKSWQLSRLRAAEAKGLYLPLAEQAGLNDSIGGTFIQSDESFSPFLVSQKSRSQDHVQQIHEAKTSQPFMPSQKALPVNQQYQYKFKNTPPTQSVPYPFSAQKEADLPYSDL